MEIVGPRLRRGPVVATPTTLSRSSGRTRMGMSEPRRGPTDTFARALRRSGLRPPPRATPRVSRSWRASAVSKIDRPGGRTAPSRRQRPRPPAAATRNPENSHRPLRVRLRRPSRAAGVRPTAATARQAAAESSASPMILGRRAWPVLAYPGRVEHLLSLLVFEKCQSQPLYYNP